MSSPPVAPQAPPSPVEELNATAIARGTALGLTVVFLLVIVAVPLIDLTSALNAQASKDSRSVGERAPVLRLLSSPPALRDYPFPIQTVPGPSLDHPASRIEQDIEAASSSKQWMQPHIQEWLTTTLRTGNDSVLMGTDSWLFFRDGVDYLAGRGFLRHGSGSSGSGTDPRAVIIDFHRQCQAAGVALLVVPISDKAALEQQRLTGVESNGYRFSNPSFASWKQDLAAAGVAVLTVDEVMRHQAADLDAFLRQDTHWTPAAMLEVARGIAHHPLVEVATGTRSWQRDPVPWTGHGDLASLLRLPPGSALIQPQTITIGQVSDASTGMPWATDHLADIVLLGDSFTNIFQTPDLGWGESGGLGAQLSFLLHGDLDVIALNGDGANGPRRRLASRPQPWSGKRLVIWAFAERELATATWQKISLSPAQDSHGP